MAITEENSLKEEPKPESLPRQAPDGGWGWLVVFSAYCILFINEGTRSSFGVFYNEILDYFKASRSATAWVPSIMIGTYALIGIVASMLTVKYGFRVVTIIGGVVASAGLIIGGFAQSLIILVIFAGFCSGVGFGFTYLAVIVCVTTYFTERRALASGIAYCGIGIGTCAMSYLSQILISNYGWKTALQINGGVVASIAIFATVFRPLKSDNVKHEEENHTDKSCLSALSGLKDLKFVYFTFITFINCCAMDIPYIFTDNRAVTMGIATEDKSNLLLSAMGISDAIGRIAIGFIGCKWKHPRSNLFLYSTSNSIAGLACCVSPFAKNFEQMAVCSAVYGAALGATCCIQPLVVVDLIGLENFANSLGVMFAVEGIARLTGPPLAGWLCDVTGSYDPPFLVFGTVMALDGLLFTFVPCIGRKQDRTRDRSINGSTVCGIVE